MMLILVSVGISSILFFAVAYIVDRRRAKRKLINAKAVTLRNEIEQACFHRRSAEVILQRAKEAHGSDRPRLHIQALEYYAAYTRSLDEIQNLSSNDFVGRGL